MKCRSRTNEVGFTLTLIYLVSIFLLETPPGHEKQRTFWELT